MINFFDLPLKPILMDIYKLETKINKNIHNFKMNVLKYNEDTKQKHVETKHKSKIFEIEKKFMEKLNEKEKKKYVCKKKLFHTFSPLKEEEENIEEIIKLSEIDGFKDLFRAKKKNLFKTLKVLKLKKTVEEKPTENIKIIDNTESIINHPIIAELPNFQNRNNTKRNTIKHLTAKENKITSLKHKFHSLCLNPNSNNNTSRDNSNSIYSNYDQMQSKSKHAIKALLTQTTLPYIIDQCEVINKELYKMKFNTLPIIQ